MIENRVDSLKKVIYEKKKIIYIDALEDNNNQWMISEKNPKIYDRNNKVIGEFISPSIYFISSIEDIPRKFIELLIQAEDRNFYHHYGVSIRGIFRSIWINLKDFQLTQGGSTITQQLSKILFTKRERSLSRKFFELYTSLYLEMLLSKEEILILYANFVYFGHGKMGIYQAADFFFQKRPSNLSLIESASLVSVIPNPTAFSPFQNFESFQKRLFTLLKSAEKKDLVPKDYKDFPATQHFLNQISFKKEIKSSLWPMSINRAPHYNEYIRRQIQKEYSFKEFLSMDTEVKTGLDLDFNLIGEKVVQEHSKRIRIDNPKAQIALIALDNKTGEVVTAIGGNSFHVNNQYLRFSQMKRPVGSIVKSLVYLLGFGVHEYNITDIVEDSPISITNSKTGKEWSPQNYNRKFSGEVTYEEAFVRSLNIPSVRILQSIEPSYLTSYIDRILEKRNNIPVDLSISLGSFSLSLEDVSVLYQSIANKGVVFKPTYIKSIREEKKTKKINYYLPNTFSQMIISQTSFNKMFYLMEQVFKNPRGTGHKVYKQHPEVYDISIYGKTGTSQNHQDAWFTGFTDRLTVVVWVGNDDNTALKSASSSLALPIWLDYIERVYRFFPKNSISL